MTAEPRAASVGARAAPTSSAYHGLRPRMAAAAAVPNAVVSGKPMASRTERVPEIFSQVGESYPAGVCEQHPDKRDLGNDLR